jgi:hypothetical protein
MSLTVQRTSECQGSPIHYPSPLSAFPTVYAWARRTFLWRQNAYVTVYCLHTVWRTLPGNYKQLYLYKFHNYICSTALYGTESWTLQTVDEKHRECFELWCWRRIEKISWTDNTRNEEVLLRVKEYRNIVHGIRKRKDNWIGHILCRNCLLWQGIEGKVKWGIEVTGRLGWRRRRLLDGLKERRGNWHLKEEALDRTVWRAGFGRGFGPVVRQTAEWMSEWKNEFCIETAFYGTVDYWRKDKRRDRSDRKTRKKKWEATIWR